MIEIEARLDELKATGLHRRTRLVSGPQGPHVLLDGKPVLVLCSDNYLGLADHPRVREAAADAAMRWGVGAGAGRLESGTMTIHRRLEERLAELKAREAALLFGSGYLANAGALAALARPGDIVFCDQLSHPSLVDGCRLSRADVFMYEHGDLEHLAWGIQEAEGRGVLIATEGLFAIDGALAPLEEIVALARRHELRVLVDDSHGTGALGPDGRGACAEAGLEDEVDVITGTLGAALGSYGGFAACDRKLASHLINSARTFMFSTAPPPPAVAGALAALDELVQRPNRIHRLLVNAAALRSELARQGFAAGGAGVQIVPLLVGDPRTSAEIADAALARGLFVQAVRPPAAPAIASSIRLAAMASHREEELRAAAQLLAKLARAAGVEPVTRVVPARRHPEPEEPPVQRRDRSSPAPFDHEAPVRRAA
jgi:glycine C-acetyltransferase/8-amino-7-oxononanoate synthase